MTARDPSKRCALGAGIQRHEGTRRGCGGVRREEKNREHVTWRQGPIICGRDRQARSSACSDRDQRLATTHSKCCKSMLFELGIV
jgi:hypothetical protein